MAIKWYEAKQTVEDIGPAIIAAHYAGDFDRVRWLKKQRCEIKLRLMEFKNAAKRKNPIVGAKA